MSRNLCPNWLDILKMMESHPNELMKFDEAPLSPRDSKLVTTLINQMYNSITNPVRASMSDEDVCNCVNCREAGRDRVTDALISISLSACVSALSSIAAASLGGLPRESFDEGLDEMAKYLTKSLRIMAEVHYKEYNLRNGRTEDGKDIGIDWNEAARL